MKNHLTFQGPVDGGLVDSALPADCHFGLVLDGASALGDDMSWLGSQSLFYREREREMPRTRKGSSGALCLGLLNVTAAVTGGVFAKNTLHDAAMGQKENSTRSGVPSPEFQSGGFFHLAVLW